MTNEETEQQLPEPWIAIGNFAQNLIDELIREVGAAHVLWKVPALPIAQRVDNDDVLFEIESELGTRAVVHLTWSGTSEADRLVPDTRIFADGEAWARAALDEEE